MFFLSVFPWRQAAASLIGQEVQLCTDLSFPGGVTADPADCEQIDPMPIATVVDPGVEFPNSGFPIFTNHRGVDVGPDFVSIIYEDYYLCNGLDVILL